MNHMPAQICDICLSTQTANSLMKVNHQTQAFMQFSMYSGECVVYIVGIDAFQICASIHPKTTVLQ